MPESYPFPTYSGLLEPEHYKKIGSALWLFLWCVSSTTKEIERDGVTWGIVLGNKPLKRAELAEPFGVSERTVQRWLDDLEAHGYIKVTRAPYGYILTVKNSKKYNKERVDKNVQSDGDRTKTSSPEWTEMSSHVDKSVHSNKDITKINNTTITITKENDPVDIIAERFIELRTMLEGRTAYPSTKDYEAIARIVARGMPLPQTIKLLEQCFAEYKERQPNGAIKAFGYCEKYIMDHYEALIARERAKEAAKNVKPFKSTNSYKHKGMRSKPIRTEMLPDWFDDGDQQHEKPKLLKNEQQELAKKKADLQEKLKLLRSGS
ncbi:HTH domain-containing protein [Cytobacillus firmus]|uniref:HTH domain-containing protein n=1 Tax=Cytobacillus firmus TaxID=1399 RepID=UPI0024C1255D|nr:HTH domain-containing protein [Cytobacillus firmus]WHY35629.1 HTH domain-containing protein [Cytobacillus firmus]